MHIASPTILKQASQQLSKYDAILAPVITKVGVCTIFPHRNYYWELIDSIISQQLSVKAAASIENRFRTLLKSDYPTPEAILAVSVDSLRTAGLSRPKAIYIHDLAQHIQDGKVKFDTFETLSNEAIITELTLVKGIGEWTAHMFLIFCMGRLDVLATGDLGIRNGVRKLYGFEQPPNPIDIRQVAIDHHWHPYESVACWYVWRSLNNLPA